MKGGGALCLGMAVHLGMHVPEVRYKKHWHLIRACIHYTDPKKGSSRASRASTAIHNSKPLGQQDVRFRCSRAPLQLDVNVLRKHMEPTSDLASPHHGLLRRCKTEARRPALAVPQRLHGLAAIL